MGRTAPAVVGIDAGGTAIRAKAVAAGAVVYSGVGGPGNPLAVSPQELARNYAAALDGCPQPELVAACVAGAGASEGRRRVERLMGERFPGTAIHVVPDYVAAFMAAKPETDVVTIAGTGSVVCSRSADGSYRVSGGHGWIVGDHGSAARLGRAFVERHCARDAVDRGDAEAMQRVYGASDSAVIVDALHSSGAPAAYLAKAAPLLTAAVEEGEAWALSALAAEMRLLASTTAAHIRRWGPSQARPVRVELAGGVWRSPSARSAFERALVGEDARATVAVCTTSPTDGATRLALELARLR